MRLLRGDVTEDAHLHAADAVANLSVQNPKGQKAFFEAGAVPLLLVQLHSGKSQTSVANAIAKLLSPAAEPGSPANADVQMEVLWWACAGGSWSATRSRRRSLRGGCLGHPDSCQSSCADKGRAKSQKG